MTWPLGIWLLLVGGVIGLVINHLSDIDGIGIQARQAVFTEFVSKAWALLKDDFKPVSPEFVS